MKTFLCRINQSLYRDTHNHEDGGCDMFFELALPFIPQPNLGIIFESYLAVIDQTTWNNDEGYFNCSIKNENDIFYNYAPLFNYETRKQDLIKNGWKISHEA